MNFLIFVGITSSVAMMLLAAYAKWRDNSFRREVSRNFTVGDHSEAPTGGDRE